MMQVKDRTRVHLYGVSAVVIVMAIGAFFWFHYHPLQDAAITLTSKGETAHAAHEHSLAGKSALGTITTATSATSKDQIRPSTSVDTELAGISNNLFKETRPGYSRLTGHITDLTEEQELEAMACWAKAAEGWSLIREFSGDAAIKFIGADGNGEVELPVRINFVVSNPDPEKVDWRKNSFPPYYTMIVSDTDGKWKYKFDSKTGASELQCEDPGLRADLAQHVNPMIGAFFWQAADTLANPATHKQIEVADAPGTIDEFFSHHQPMRNPDLPDAQGAYAFVPAAAAGRKARGEIQFQDGQLESVSYKDSDGAVQKLSYGDYTQVKDHWFPKRYVTDFRSGSRSSLEFSNLKVEFYDKVATASSH